MSEGPLIALLTVPKEYKLYTLDLRSTIHQVPMAVNIKGTRTLGKVIDSLTSALK